MPKIIKRKTKRKKAIKRFFTFDDTKYIYILAGIVFLAGILLLGWFTYQSLIISPYDYSFVSDMGTDKKKTEEECQYRRKLDGVCVKFERYTDPKLVVVMIENNLEAWPLSSLAEAQIVYEAPVEGNIPRFMAIYTIDTKIEQAGPVRSARPYYLDWASEYGNAMYMHVGGSEKSLELIDTYNLFSINEFYRDWYFWRSDKRARPHNTYTSSELWNKAYDDYGEYQKQEDYDGWVFKETEPCIDECVMEIKVSIASWSAYHAIWKFNTTTQKYIRWQGEEQNFDIDGTQIVADTVIVQRVRASVIDEIGRKRIDTIGNGNVFIFRNGQMVKGQWFKASRKDRTQFYDANGDIIPLQAGKIWIEILPDNRELEWE